MAIGWNDYRVFHNEVKWGKYLNVKNLPGTYSASRHSELHLATKLGEDDWSRYEIYNIRVNNCNEIALSKPCANCFKIVRSMTPKRMYFSNDLGEFEELIIN